MKGAPGLAIALILGLLAAVLNWIYLENKTKDVDSISFLGVRDDTEIKPGEPFQHRHFVEVKIPARHARNLKDFVYLHKDVNTIVGTPATQAYQGGELIRREDYLTPASELELDKGTFLRWVSVDPKFVVPELINPGDQIKFHFPANIPAPSVLSKGGQSPGAARSGPPGGMQSRDLVAGPFRVKTLGNRLGRVDVMRANRRSPAEEQKIGIVIDERDAEELARYDHLVELERLVDYDFRDVRVTLHGGN